VRRLGVLLAVVLGCGQPEDVLVLEGSLRGVAGGDPTGQKVTLYRDLGATELGCTEFSQWQTLELGADGGFRIEHLRQETQGRFGLPRCLRLQWTDGVRTARLSWPSASRSTQLPPLLTWFDLPGSTPSMPQGTGSVTAQQQSFEVLDARGTLWRQPLGPGLLFSSQLSGPGPAPAVDAGFIHRLTQRGQYPQIDGLGQEPLLEFEYAIELREGGFSGSPGNLELGHGSACNLKRPGVAGCALTDGLFDVLPAVGAASEALELQLKAPTVVQTVVVRGLGAFEPFTTVAVDARETDDGEWVPSGTLQVSVHAQVLLTGTLEDERPVLYGAVHWVGPVGPVKQVRVRLEDAAGAPVAIGWVGEVSLY
jgi:hypothetical protein